MPEHEPSEQTKLSSAELLASIEARFEERLQAKREGMAAAPAQAIPPVAKPAEEIGSGAEEGASPPLHVLDWKAEPVPPEEQARRDRARGIGRGLTLSDEDFADTDDEHGGDTLRIETKDLPPEDAPVPPAQGEPLVVTHEDLDNTQPGGELAPASPEAPLETGPLSNKLEWEWPDDDDPSMQKAEGLVRQVDSIRKKFENYDLPPATSKVRDDLLEVKQAHSQTVEVMHDLSPPGADVTDPTVTPTRKENHKYALARTQECIDALKDCISAIAQKMQDYRVNTGVQFVFTDKDESDKPYIFARNTKGRYIAFYGNLSGGLAIGSIDIKNYDLISINPSEFENRFADSYKPNSDFEWNPGGAGRKDEQRMRKEIYERFEHAKSLGFNVVFSQNEQEFELRQDVREELRLIRKDRSEFVAQPLELAKNYTWKLRPIIT